MKFFCPTATRIPIRARRVPHHGTHRRDQRWRYNLRQGCLPYWLSIPGLSLQQISASTGLRQQERRILPGLVGVRLAEDSNSALESIASPQVATDLSRVAGARMGTGESPATEP